VLFDRHTEFSVSNVTSPKSRDAFESVNDGLASINSIDVVIGRMA
jgi:hypothetical protein